MSATFKYKGTFDTLYVSHEGVNHELKKSERFTTDDPRLIARLREHPDIEEVKEAPAEAGKRSRPSDGRP